MVPSPPAVAVSPPEWLSHEAPWLTPVAPAVCADLPLRPSDIPVVDAPGAPCSLAELVALRSGCFIPVYGRGPTEPEARRTLTLLTNAYGPSADPLGAEHALAMTLHPALGTAPIIALARAVANGDAAAWQGELALGYVTVLGAGDALRVRVAEALWDVPALAAEATVARAVSGGDFGTWREHYQALRMAESAHPPVAVARQWFDFVLGRRWSGIDALRTMADDPRLDGTARWLAASGLWVSGDESARVKLTDLAQSVLDPLHTRMPRLSAVVAREVAELLARPWELRWDHLRSAAARDHAAAAIRAWLRAATEVEPEEVSGGDDLPLGPEPSRAGRAAVESRQGAGEFLLDWFVPEREARAGVDRWAAKALRTWHRLRGAATVARALQASTPGIA